MKVSYRKIILIVFVSSLIGFAFNFLNPNGIPLLKQERTLVFEDDEKAVIDTADTKLAVPHDSVTGNMKIKQNEISLTEEIFPDVPKPFSQPIAIKLSRAYQLYQQGVTFIDSRSREEYSEGHIKGSINIPFYESEKYEDVLRKIDKNNILVTYCSGEDCDTSILHGEELFEKGYKRVYIFFGGWNEWLEAGYPIESSK